MTAYDITITIENVETEDLEQLEILCEMMEELCETVCRKCDYAAVKRFDPPNYELEEVKE